MLDPPGKSVLGSAGRPPPPVLLPLGEGLLVVWAATGMFCAKSALEGLVLAEADPDGEPDGRTVLEGDPDGRAVPVGDAEVPPPPPLVSRHSAAAGTTPTFRTATDAAITMTVRAKPTRRIRCWVTIKPPYG